MSKPITDVIKDIAKDNPDNCPNCGSTPKNHTLEDYDMMWHDGVIRCDLCGHKVRNYDAG